MLPNYFAGSRAANLFLQEAVLPIYFFFFAGFSVANLNYL
jgi:hypothetical protein